jgi:hypothetical protein
MDYFYLVDEKCIFLCNSQCKSWHFILWVYVNLDHGCMTRNFIADHLSRIQFEN